MTPYNIHTRTIEVPNAKATLADIHVPITPAENVLAYYRVMAQTGCYKELEDAIRYHVNRLNECIDYLNVNIDLKASITTIEAQIETLKDNSDGILQALTAIQRQHYQNGTEMDCDD